MKSLFTIIIASLIQSVALAESGEIKNAYAFTRGTVVQPVSYKIYLPNGEEKVVRYDHNQDVCFVYYIAEFRGLNYDFATIDRVRSNICGKKLKMTAAPCSDFSKAVLDTSSNYITMETTPTRVNIFLVNTLPVSIECN